MPYASPALYGRKVEVQVGLPGQQGRAWGDGIRITFEVKAGVGRKPNEAKIEVYGLTRDSAAFCAQTGAMVNLLAGYVEPGLIFQGDIDRSRTVSTRPERVTTIEARDGGRTFSTARISKSYAQATSVLRALDDLAGAMDLTLGAVDAGVQSQQFADGITLHGYCRDSLDTIAQLTATQWSIQDGVLQILQPTGHTGEQAPDIGPDSGLVGSPVPMYDDARRVKGIELTCLLTPTLKPGRRFMLRSREFTGIYRCEQVTHVGDSFGGDFFTKIQAKEVAA